MDSCPVRVALRVRPLSFKEETEGSISCVSFIPNTSQIVVGSDRSFTFDYVFSPDTAQETVYQYSAQPLVDKLMDGFNTTIFAYGQTGSGKTFSMGTSIEYADSPESQGIVPRAVYNIFEIIRARYKELPHYKCEVLITFLELYNEELIDLLNPNTNAPKTNGGRPNSYHAVKGPTIREDPQGGIYWKGVTEVPVVSPSEVLDHLYKGLIGRTTASTEMNSTSSRSHAIFSITIKQVMEIEEQIMNDDNTEVLSESPDSTPELRQLTSKFHFVDLAGSERLKRTHAVGGRAKEGISINAGLLALGNVISALGDESRKSSHIPYRDSKLTRLLQDSIGGNSQTLMLACISPSDSNFLETLNTLKYANRARNIKNRVQVNQGTSTNPAEEISRLRNEIAKLKHQLQNQSSISPQNNHTQETKDPEKVKRLERRIFELTEEVVSLQTDRDMLVLKISQDSGLDLHNDLSSFEITNYSQQLLELKKRVEAYELAFDNNPYIKHKTKKSDVLLTFTPTNPNDDINPRTYYQNNLNDINGESKELHAELDEISINLANMQLNTNDDSNSDSNYSDNPAALRRAPHTVSKISGLRNSNYNDIRSLGNTPLSTPPELLDSGNERDDVRVQKLQNKIKDLQYKINLITREKDDLMRKLNSGGDKKIKTGSKIIRKTSENSDILSSPEGSVKTIADPSIVRLQDDLNRSLKENKMLSDQLKKIKQPVRKARANSQLALRETVPKKPLSAYPDFKASQKSVSGLRSAYKKKLLEQEIQQFLLGRRARKILSALMQHFEKLQVEQAEIQNKKDELNKCIDDKIENPSLNIDEEELITTLEELEERLNEITAEMDYTSERIKNQEANIEAKIHPIINTDSLNPLLKDDLYGESNYRAALKILYELEPTEIYGMLELMLRDLVTLKMTHWNLQNKIKQLSDDLAKKDLIFNSFQKTVATLTFNYEKRIAELIHKSGYIESDSFDPLAPNMDSEVDDIEQELLEVERLLNE